METKNQQARTKTKASGKKRNRNRRNVTKGVFRWVDRNIPGSD